MKSIIIFSGGLDSTVLVYRGMALGHDQELISFDYGQRHQREMEHARLIAAREHLPHEIVSLRPVGLLSGSALTSPDIPVPDGYYTDESMKITVVPNRNMIFLSLAVGIALSRGADRVVIGIHAGDHAIYPDCRLIFLESFRSTARLATLGVGSVDVSAPFLRKSKTDIVRYGFQLAVPFELSWSCYKGGNFHCGTCGTCTERREAFREAGVPDPTFYETDDTPRKQVERSKETDGEQT